MASSTVSSRPRVLILGGGFAGDGAAQQLKDADAEVVLVCRHDYHTFQPLAKDVVDWAGAAVTHERPGRIRVESS